MRRAFDVAAAAVSSFATTCGVIEPDTAMRLRARPAGVQDQPAVFGECPRRRPACGRRGDRARTPR